jgi:hypothetical protein
MKHVTLVLASLLVVPASVLGACSSTTTIEEKPAATVEAGTTIDASSDGADSGAALDDASDLPSGDAVCKAKSTGDACGICCNSTHIVGSHTFSTLYLGCLCNGVGADGGTDGGGVGPCADACATTVCAAHSVAGDKACNTCLDAVLSATTGVCYGSIIAGCKAEADCIANEKCISECPM